MTEQPTRNTSELAFAIMEASDETIMLIAKRDPNAFRDIAAALIYERDAYFRVLGGE